ncbi:MAG: GNAT family N-acetyltransferase, partial [Betaproteobacteria bacterium]
MQSNDVTIVAGTIDDIALVQRLADSIWRRHYPGILSDAQIDYMLARGYAREVLAAFVAADGAGLAIVRSGGDPAGFAAWVRDREPMTTKLDKLYVEPALHGRGLGRALIAHVEDAARRDGARTLVL